MDSIIALIQGMGLFHLQWGQAVMIAISLLLLWLAIKHSRSRACHDSIREFASSWFTGANCRDCCEIRYRC